jgi:hypothetical protein
MAFERIGIDDIRAGFDMHKTRPYYALFAKDPGNGRSGDKVGPLIYSYTGDDLEGEGWDMLQQNLAVAERSQPDMPFIIRFYQEAGRGGSITSNTEYCASFPLRIQAYQRSEIGKIGALPGADSMTYINEIFALKLQNLQDKYDRKFDDREREHEEELEALREELEGNNSKDMGQIGAVLDTLGAAGERHPWLQELIKKVGDSVCNLLNLAPNAYHKQYNAAGGGIAGVPDMDAPTTKEDIMKSLDNSNTRLAQFFIAAASGNKDQGLQAMAVKFKKLADMAETDPGKLKGLLMFL